jgi:pilus assembly protein CpaC
MRMIFVLALLAFTLAAPGAFAKKPAPVALATKPASQAAMMINLNEGKLVTLSAPAASVFVASPEIADVQVLSPKRVMVFGKKVGKTSFIALDDQQNILTERPVTVRQNLADLEQALAASLPGSRIKAQSVPGGIVLSGEVRNGGGADDAEKLAARYLSEGGTVINKIGVSGPSQIHLRVRVAEVSRTVAKQFGINWETVGSLGKLSMGFATGAAPMAASGAFPFSRIGKSYAGALGGSYNGDVNGLIDALADEGLVTVLAEPNLTAMTGETASFLAGGEFPIPIPQSNGTISIDFKPYGVSLAFTPTILDGGRINLHVRPEVSQLSEAGSITLNNITIPALTTRRTETTVELGSGESFAVAGLLQSNQSQDLRKFPGLGDLPVLGALFRSSSFQNNESELVIIITPYLVSPTRRANLETPLDGLAATNDSDRILYGKQIGAALLPPSPQHLAGPVGLTMEAR